MRYVPTLPTKEQAASIKHAVGAEWIGWIRPVEPQPQVLVAVRFPTPEDVRQWRAYASSADADLKAKANTLLASACMVWPESQQAKQALFDAFPLADSSIAECLLKHAGATKGGAVEVDEAALSFRSGEG